MFTAIGWICIQESYLDEFGDERFEPRPQTVEAVDELLSQVRPDPEAALLREHNMTHTLLIDCHHNHRTTWPIDVFRRVPRLAPESFGTLHVYDDEHPDERYRWMRWTMVRGDIRVDEDRGFAPVVRAWFDGRHPLDAPME